MNEESSNSRRRAIAVTVQVRAPEFRSSVRAQIHGLVRPKHPISRRARTAAFPSKPTVLRVWARPYVVEGSRVQGQQPAARDPPVTDLVQAHGRPAPLDATDHGRPIGERRNAVTVADQDIAWVHPEGAIHQ